MFNKLKIRVLAVLYLLLHLPGCAVARKYAQTPKGEIGGRLTLEWIGADKFIYRPDPAKPFYFKRANGEVIQPRSVYTDGGSIPRPLWAFRAYSPWGFGAAYVAHNWLFAAHHCHYPEAKNHTVFTAADVLSECMKTLMETNPNVIKSPELLYTVDQAVRTKIAQNLWEKGECQKPPPELPQAKTFTQPLEAPTAQHRWVQTYDFDRLEH